MFIILGIVIILGVSAIFASRIQQKEIKRTGKYPKGYYTSKGLGIFRALGVVFGVVFGNFSLGLIIGLVIGVAIGTAWETKNKSKLRPLTLKEEKIRSVMLIVLGVLFLLGVVVFFIVN